MASELAEKWLREYAQKHGANAGRYACLDAFDAGREPLLAENRKLTEERDGYLKQLQDDPLAEENRKLRESLTWYVKHFRTDDVECAIACALLAVVHPTPAPGSTPDLPSTGTFTAIDDRSSPVPDSGKPAARKRD